MKNKTETKIQPFIHRISPVAQKAKPLILSLFLTAVIVLSNPAFAGNGAELFKAIVKVLGALSTAGGAIYGIIGLIAYAEAKSEGEGPAMAKAKNQLVGAVMLMALGVAMIAGSSAIAGMIQDNITL